MTDKAHPADTLEPTNVAACPYCIRGHVNRINPHTGLAGRVVCLVCKGTGLEAMEGGPA